MSKVKGLLEEDMKRYPELYNGYADYEFWMQCRKEKKKKSHKQKGKKKRIILNINKVM